MRSQPVVTVIRTADGILWDAIGPQRDPVVLEVVEGQEFHPKRVTWNPPGRVQLEMHHSLLLILPERSVKVKL